MAFVAIENISDTAVWVAYYRAKETLRPDAMFQDRLAQKLIGGRGKKIADEMGSIGRYTEWSVISRTVIIDRFIDALVLQGIDAVINLGAGFDTRPYRLKLPENLEWIEVDCAEILALKSKVLKSEKAECQLSRDVLDLRSGNDRRNFFRQIVPHAKKVLILTEGLIPYLSQDEVAALSQDILREQRFIYWITEYFDPKVYRTLKSTLKTAKMKNAPFRFFPDNWYKFFAGLGWHAQETQYSSSIAAEFKRPLPMPLLVKLLLPLMSKKVRDQATRMTGFVLLKRIGND